MKKALIALISLVLVISTTFPAFAESEAMDGPFHMRWLAEGETHEDYNVNGLYRALLVYYAGLSLNMDEYSSNDVDLSDISNKYEISFDTHSAFITFNTRESYVVVFFMPNSDESFLLSIPLSLPVCRQLFKK